MKHVRIFLTEEEQWRSENGYDPLSEADHAIVSWTQENHASPACPRCNPEGYASLYARHRAFVIVPGPVDQLLSR